mmetsp:Transcript_27904/g.70090  ORF Transcript_27904/g.70090 Transcript_27904/m.70090 type:complete len:220 (+) Transcript_27904:152-811(+)
MATWTCRPTTGQFHSTSIPATLNVSKSSTSCRSTGLVLARVVLASTVCFGGGAGHCPVAFRPRIVAIASSCTLHGGLYSFFDAMRTLPVAAAMCCLDTSRVACSDACICPGSTYVLPAQSPGPALLLNAMDVEVLVRSNAAPVALWLASDGLPGPSSVDSRSRTALGLMCLFWSTYVVGAHDVVRSPRWSAPRVPITWCLAETLFSGTFTVLKVRASER